MQRNHIDLLTPLTSCVRGGLDSAEWAVAALEDLYLLVHSEEEEEEVAAAGSEQGVALLTQHYREDNGGQDLTVVLVKNLMNPYISDIYLFNDEEFDFSRLPHAHKIHQVLLKGGGRLRFQHAIEFASAQLRGRSVIIGKWAVRCMDYTLHTYFFTGRSWQTVSLSFSFDARYLVEMKKISITL